MKDLSKITTEKLLEELEKRKETPKSETIFIVGTICNERGTNYVGVFKKAASEKDLGFIHTAKLRARFNSHRAYRLFYFHSDKFEELEKSLNEDVKTFGNWVANNKNIKFLGL